MVARYVDENRKAGTRSEADRDDGGLLITTGGEADGSCETYEGCGPVELALGLGLDGSGDLCSALGLLAETRGQPNGTRGLRVRRE